MWAMVTSVGVHAAWAGLGVGWGLKQTSRMQAAERAKKQGKTAVVETGHSCVC